MLDITGIGSEGVILITAFLIFKDIIIPLWKRVFIPWWGKKVLRRPNPDDTLRRLNPNSITLAEVVTSLKKHEEMDKDRTNEIKQDIKDLEKDLKKHGERLARLESPGR